MDSDDMAQKRARLLACRARWSGANDVNPTQPLNSSNAENSNQDSIQKWLISITEEDAKAEAVQEAPVQILKRNASLEDDLALGVEASLYGNQTVRTTQRLLGSSLPRPPLSRWSSLASAFSTHSGPLSVMDVLNLWQDDPEELLLDLGFGAEEPDITVKIPARFINHQSKARGINIQLFLEAQKNRMDIENPDVSHRFRQLEVLQQVTTAFNSLVGGSAQAADKPAEPSISAETRERRKRVGMLLRKASKKTLSQAPVSQDQPSLSPLLAEPSSVPELPGDPLLDKRSPVKRARQCLPESASLSPLIEEQSSVSEAAEHAEFGASTPPQQKICSPKGTGEPQSGASSLAIAQRNPGQPAESFELEEIQSFDEGSVAGSYAGTPDHTSNDRASLSRVSSCVVRTNSCQSDSSGFLEEPIVPAFYQHPSSGPELMKVLHAMSGDSSDSQQKSVDLQEKDFHLPDSQGSEKLDEYSESVVTDSNTDLVTEKTLSEQVLSEEDTTENLLQGVDQVDCLVDLNVGQKDITDECVRESPTIQGKSPSPRPDVVPESDYQVEVLKSDTSPCDIDSSPTGAEVDITESGVSSPTECNDANGGGAHFGRSVSVQMLSSLGLVSQSSLRGSVSHSPSLEYGSPNSVQLWRDSSDVQSNSCADNTLDRVCGSDVAGQAVFEVDAPMLQNCCRSQESSGGLQGPRAHLAALEAGTSYEDDGRWENTLMAGTQCCCACDHNCRCCCQNRRVQKQYSGSSVQPFSLDELEGMMRCMRKFRRVLSQIEERVQEEQASVLSSLSDAHRDEVQDVLLLRAAVKQEAVKLEQQLTDLVHAYDDSIKMKMNRLLDEQSELCAQLKITPSDTPQTGQASTRNVAIQCSLMPVMDTSESHLSQQAVTDQSFSQESEWSPSSKADKLGFVGFIRSLKDVSVSNDSLE